MDTFLPDSYEVPTTKGNYLKFEDGDNKVRILSSPILGYEYWIDTEDGKRKPIRKKMDETLNLSDIPNPEEIKHFWAMIVYNYNDKKIQIMEITQATIQRKLRALAKDEDWGSPKNYDIVINKTGEKLLTKYEVQPKPAKPLDKKIEDLYKKSQIELEALYRGDDPFKSSQEKINPDDIPL